MINPKSIRFRLSLVFVFFITIALSLGFFSIKRIRDLSSESTDIRDHLLRSAQLLGDLNNFTSDFRSAEATMLLSERNAEQENIEAEIKSLDIKIAQTQNQYRENIQGAAELEKYLNFEKNWQIYRRIVDQELYLYRQGDYLKSKMMYLHESRDTFKKSSDLLDKITEQNVLIAHKASERIAQANLQTQVWIDLAMLLISLMTISAIFYVYKAISKPLVRIARTMHQVADSDVELLVPYQAREDEIGEMAKALVVFQNNARELSASRLTLLNQASILEEKLAQEKQLMAQQKRFVSMISHEFRTPLGVIDGHAQRMVKLSHELAPEDIIKRATKVRSMVSQLTYLLDHLLEVSLFSDGDINQLFNPSDIDLARIIHDLCELYRGEHPDASISEDLGADLKIYADPKLINQLLSNLFSNAIKYSPTPCRISVQAHKEGEWIVLSVQDSGIGIAEKDKELIFNSSYRGSNVSDIPGTGMGLYLVHTITELHAGQVFVESEEGAGCKFTIKLPTRRTGC